MIRKLLMSALIVFVGNDHDYLRLVFGFSISFVSLVTVLLTRPFVSQNLQILMVMSLVTQTLTIACTYIHI